MGNTYTPVVDSCQRMAKPIQYCKVISLQFKYIYMKKNSPTVRIFKNLILMERVVNYPLNILDCADFHCRIFFLICQFFSVLFLVRFDISLSSSY